MAWQAAATTRLCQGYGAASSRGSAAFLMLLGTFESSFDTRLTSPL